MTDEYERPASVGHLQELESRLAGIDEALRRIEAREDETWAFRMELYPKVRHLPVQLAWVFGLLVVVFVLNVTWQLAA